MDDLNRFNLNYLNDDFHDDLRFEMDCQLCIDGPGVCSGGASPGKVRWDTLLALADQVQKWWFIDIWACNGLPWLGIVLI